MSKHAEVRRTGRWGSVALVVAAVTLLTAAGASAGGFLSPGVKDDDANAPKPGYVAPAKRMDVSGDGPDALVAELKNAEMRVREAWQNAFTAEEELTRARTRRYPRGAALEELRQRTVELGNEQIAAEKDFVQTVEKARRGGVPMGQLAPYMDFEQEIRARQQSRTAGD
jgi:hypothetical protein